jgi:hypothetical protein
LQGVVLLGLSGEARGHHIREGFGVFERHRGVAASV